MTTRSIFRATLLFLLCSLFSYFLLGQSYQPAIAYPLPTIEVDGNLKDWPKDHAAYPITSVAFGDISGPEDIQASFRVGFRPTENALYVAIEVTDSDPVDKGEAGIIDNVDHVLLYLDPLHRPQGGSRSLFQAGINLRELSSQAPEAWSPYTPELSWDDVTHIAQHPEKDKTIHEWRFDLGKHLRPGSVIGLDFIIADVDRAENGDSWTTWRPGTSKSAGSQRLGDVLLAPSKKALGSVQGQVTVDDQWGSNVRHVRLIATDNPALWFRVPVNAAGNYHCQVPAGEYKIVTDHGLYTPQRREGVFQPTHRIIDKNRTVVSVAAGEVSTAPLLEIIPQPLPGGLFESEGVLFQDQLPTFQIDRFLQTFQDYYAIPGVSVAVLQNGKVVYDKTFGVTNKLTQEPLQPNSLFEGASTTKPTFSLLVLKLAEEGKIDLDKPLYQYLRFPNLEHDERYKLLTARHVLHHQSGLDNWSVRYYTGNAGDTPANFNFTPGTAFGYSGEAFNYLGRVVEKLTGKSNSALFLEELAPAMGMEATHLAYINDLEDKIATGHWHGYPRYKDKYPGVDSPASSLHTSAHDFSNLLVGLYQQKYLSKASYELIYTPRQILTEEQRYYDKEQPQGIAHGFFVSETPQGKRLEHGGNNGDFRCKFALFPDTGHGYAVFTNNDLGEEFIRLFELYLLQGKAGFDREFGTKK